MTRNAAFLLLRPLPIAIAREPLFAKGSTPLWGSYTRPFYGAASLKKKSAPEAQKRRVDSERKVRTGLYGKNARYYDRSLALFATVWPEGRSRFDKHGLLQVSWK